MQIEDGKGTGYKASVNKNNQLQVAATIASQQLQASARFGQAYQAASGVRNVASAGAYGILALRNDSELNMIITYIRMGVDKTETAQAKCEVLFGGTWVAGTAADDPVNLRSDSSKEPGVTAHYNSTPTGSPKVIDVHWVKGPGEVTYNKEGSIIIKKNGILSLRMTTETDAANIHGRISFIMLTDEQLAGI